MSISETKNVRDQCLPARVPTVISDQSPLAGCWLPIGPVAYAVGHGLLLADFLISRRATAAGGAVGGARSGAPILSVGSTKRKIVEKATDHDPELPECSTNLKQD